MTYPGNTNLAQEMQDRILSTFKQTLTAAGGGNRQEARLGCDFILRLDSLFSPARQLLDRLEEGEGPVETADLAQVAGMAAEAPAAATAPAPEAPPPVIDDDAAAAAAAAAAIQPPDIDDLSDLDLEMGHSDAPPPPGEREPAEPAAPPEPPEPPATAAEQAPTVASPPAEAPTQPPAPAEPQPQIDNLDDLDLGLDDSAAEPPAPAAEIFEPPSESDVPPAGASGVDELEDLDLGVDGEDAPAKEEQVARPAAEIPLGSEPAAQLDSESQQRIADLLAEGQEAFDGGEYQGAIDAWSRIFLIDIDHAEANQRIEEARRLKAEGDRQVEERFHEGLSQLEAGDTDAAAEAFRAVLELQPSHLQARDYLEKLEAGEVPVPAEIPRPAEAELSDEDFEPIASMEEGDDDQAPKARPDRGTKAVGERVVTVKKSPFKSKSFLAVAAVGLVAVLGGAWYLFNNWSTLFPNSGQEAPTTAPDPLERAKSLHEQGKTPIAIAQLRRMPPGSPRYDEAQALIAQWEQEIAPADAGTDGPTPQELARREALIAEASNAAERREYMRASELLSEAANLAPLRGAEVQLLARADEQLQDLQQYITYFREGEWDMGLRELWLKHEADPLNRDVTRLLVDSYYNLGLRSLQRKDIKEATEQFQEALELSPGDSELLRLADFAATYQSRQTDLLYRIYVKYHPFR